MSDTTAAKAKAKGGKKAAKDAGDATVEGQVGRMLVRAIWAQEYMAANPNSTPEDRKAAWKDQRTAAVEKNLKAYRRALSSLKRSGVVMTLTPLVAGAGEEDPGDDA